MPVRLHPTRGARAWRQSSGACLYPRGGLTVTDGSANDHQPHSAVELVVDDDRARRRDPTLTIDAQVHSIGPSHNRQCGLPFIGVYLLKAHRLPLIEIAGKFNHSRFRNANDNEILARGSLPDSECGGGWSDR